MPSLSQTLINNKQTLTKYAIPTGVGIASAITLKYAYDKIYNTKSTKQNKSKSKSSTTKKASYLAGLIATGYAAYQGYKLVKAGYSSLGHLGNLGSLSGLVKHLWQATPKAAPTPAAPPAPNKVVKIQKQDQELTSTEEQAAFGQVWQQKTTAPTADETSKKYEEAWETAVKKQQEEDKENFEQAWQAVQPKNVARLEKEAKAAQVFKQTWQAIQSKNGLRAKL